MKNRSKLAFAAAALLVASCASQQPAPPPPAPEPKVQAPVQEIKPAEVATPAPKPVIEKLTMTADALFDFDKFAIRPDAQAKLDDLAAKAKGVNVDVILVVGHTDSIGSDAYNMKLSQRRAEAVKKYLVGKGVPAGRVHTEGKGKSSPIADNRTKEGRQKNRRSEIEVTGTRAR